MNAATHILVLSLALAEGAPLRAVDPAWEVIEVQGETARVGERSAPLGGSSRALARLLGRDRSAVHLVRVGDEVDGRQVARFLDRLHQLGARQLALAFTETARADAGVPSREGMLPYCPAADATCIGRPWAGVRPVKSAAPTLELDKGGWSLSLNGAQAPVTLDALARALDGVKDTHLSVRTQGTTWAQLAAIIRANPLPAFSLESGRPSAIGGALEGFDSILGGLDLGGLEVGEKRDQQRSRLSRAVRSSKAAGVDVDVSAGADGPDLNRAGPVKLELSTDDDFTGESLPADFLRGVADALKAGAAPIDGCYVAAKKKQAGLAGQLAVIFRIGAGGKVTSAKIQKDRLSSPVVKACVLDVVRNLTFPAPPKGRESVVLSNTFFFK